MGLQAILGGAITDHVLSFGPLSKNNEWFLCLKTEAAKDHLLSAGFMKAKGYSFRIRSTDCYEFFFMPTLLTIHHNISLIHMELIYVRVFNIVFNIVIVQHI